MTKPSFPTSCPTSRRHFITLLGSVCAQAIAAGLGISTSPARVHANASDRAPGTPDVPAMGITSAELESSAFVYVSPLLASGKESTCHAELWYAWLDDRIVVNVAADRWKATALARGLDRAHVWIGDYGRWKGWLGRQNEAYRESRRHVAAVEKLDGPKMVERLLAAYELKYPAEIANWRDPMRKGVADGSRVILGYRLQN